MLKFLKYIYRISGLVIFKKIILIFFNRLKRGKRTIKNNSISFGIKNKHIFFGYYDINPISQKNDKILSIAVPAKKNTNSIALIGYFNINGDKKFVEIDKTKTWCWQQGARLRWSKNFDNTIIYNTLVDSKYGCVFRNIDTKKNLKEISFPIYDLSIDEKFGLSLNFSRLQNLRPGYGYSNLKDETINDKIPNDDGVFLIDIENNIYKLIISLDDLSTIEPHDSMDEAMHYINHLSWNKSGDRFLFFHLWTKGNFRSSRLFTADKNGENLFLLENEEAVSHYDWKNDYNICLTTSTKKNGTRYSIYRDLTNERDILSSEFLKQDGHPTYHPSNKEILLSDTYPDKYGERSLFTFNFNNKNIYVIKSFKSPLKYRNDYRCDLHPRWSNDGKIISFDSTHKGLRTINIIDFEDIIHT